MVESYGIRPEGLATAIAAAIHYESNNDHDPSLSQLRLMREEKGTDYILENVCKLDPKGKLAELIKEKEEMLKKEGYISE